MRGLGLIPDMAAAAAGEQGPADGIRLSAFKARFSGDERICKEAAGAVVMDVMAVVMAVVMVVVVVVLVVLVVVVLVISAELQLSGTPSTTSTRQSLITLTLTLLVSVSAASPQRLGLPDMEMPLPIEGSVRLSFRASFFASLFASFSPKGWRLIVADVPVEEGVGDDGITDTVAARNRPELVELALTSTFDWVMSVGVKVLENILEKRFPFEEEELVTEELEFEPSLSARLILIFAGDLEEFLLDVRDKKAASAFFLPLSEIDDRARGLRVGSTISDWTE